MNTIDENIFTDLVIERTPFYWGKQDNLIQKSVQSDLVCQFPHKGFVAAKRLEGAGKLYQFEVLNIITHSEKMPAFSELTPSWQAFINDLSSPAYINLLSRYVDTPIDDYSLDIGLFRFQHRDWVDIHTDRPDKILTQLFYFNENWQDDWGGHLYVLENPDLQSVLARVKPSVKASAVIVRSDNAWHYVSPVAEKAESPRLSLQVEIIKKQ